MSSSSFSAPSTPQKHFFQRVGWFPFKLRHRGRQERLCRSAKPAVPAHSPPPPTPSLPEVNRQQQQKKKSDALFAEGESSDPQSQGGARGFTAADLKHLPVAPKHTLALRLGSRPLFTQALRPRPASLDWINYADGAEPPSAFPFNMAAP